MTGGTSRTSRRTGWKKAGAHTPSPKHWEGRREWTQGLKAWRNKICRMKVKIYKESWGHGFKKITEEFDSIIVNKIWKN